MAIRYTQTLISLKRLVEKQSCEALAKFIKQENDNAGALILALCSTENRSEILKKIKQSKQLCLLKSLTNLQQPPDFVVQIVIESLESKLS
tara:strand:+ start:68 stop:340 length:273 start_codon:yes stop_codon:yes gene_type:complete